MDMVKASADNPYDVVLMDLMMHVMDGRTAAKEIRRWEQTQRKIVGKLANT